MLTSNNSSKSLRTNKQTPPDPALAFVCNCVLLCPKQENCCKSSELSNERCVSATPIKSNSKILIQDSRNTKLSESLSGDQPFTFQNQSST